MRRASESFRKQKFASAYALYAEACEEYAGQGGLKEALARFTRASFALRGEVDDDPEADIRSGLALVQGAVDAESRRFEGLFLQLAAAREGKMGNTDAAQVGFLAARNVLEEVGRPLDLIELERDRARLHSTLEDHEAARNAAERAIGDAGEDARLVIHARELLAEICLAAGDTEAAVLTLSTALQQATGSKMASKRRELAERIRELESLGD